MRGIDAGPFEGKQAILAWRETLEGKLTRELTLKHRETAEGKEEYMRKQQAEADRNEKLLAYIKAASTSQKATTFTPSSPVAGVVKLDREPDSLALES